MSTFYATFSSNKTHIDMALLNSNQHPVILKSNNYTLIIITQLFNYFCSSVSFQDHLYETHFDIKMFYLMYHNLLLCKLSFWVLCVFVSWFRNCPTRQLRSFKTSDNFFFLKGLLQYSSRLFLAVLSFYLTHWRCFSCH